MFLHDDWESYLGTYFAEAGAGAFTLPGKESALYELQQQNTSGIGAFNKRCA